MTFHKIHCVRVKLVSNEYTNNDRIYSLEILCLAIHFNGFKRKYWFKTRDKSFRSIRSINLFKDTVYG